MLLLLLFCGLASAGTISNQNEELHRSAIQSPDLFGGDMLDIDVDERNAIPWNMFRWPGAKVPYVLDASVSRHASIIGQAFQQFHQTTCVRFVPRTTQQNYVRIFSGQGCYSNVGMVGGQQTLSLGQGCIFIGTIVHELKHALGFYHEQNRSDRDQYLQIYLNNVMDGQQHNFVKLKTDQNLLLTGFDYDSIMIYGNYAFSKDGRSMTMVARNNKKLYEPYDKSGMNASDVKRVKLMYGCS